MLKSPIPAPNVVAQPEFPGSYIANLPGIVGAWSPQIEALTVAPNGKQAIRPRVGSALMTSTGEDTIPFRQVTRNGRVRTPSYTPNTGTHEWSSQVPLVAGWNSVFCFAEGTGGYNKELWELSLTSNIGLGGHPHRTNSNTTGCSLLLRTLDPAGAPQILDGPTIPTGLPFWWVVAFNSTTGEVKWRNSANAGIVSATIPGMVLTLNNPATIKFGRMRSGRHYDGNLYDIGVANSDLVAGGLTNIAAYARALYGIV